MLLTRAHAVFTIHLVEWLWSINNYDCSYKHCFKIGCRQLKKFSLNYDPINATAFLFTEIHPSHKVR